MIEIEVIDRFLNKVSPEPNSGCWLWDASLRPDGYGQFSYKRRPRLAHRFSYEIYVGPIPPDLELDHKCRVRSCVNPDHLEPVTHRENIIRSPLVRKNGDEWRRKTHCINGHPLSGDNLGYKDANKRHRRCKQCARDRARKYRDAAPRVRCVCAVCGDEFHGVDSSQCYCSPKCSGFVGGKARWKHLR